MLSKLTNSQKTAVLILATLALANLLTHGPDLIKYINTPPDKWFTGQASWFDPWDVNFYASVIGWGKRNGIPFENLYDTQPHQGMLIYTFYTITGRLTSPLNLSNISIFRLEALLLSFFLLTTVWWFIKIFIKEVQERWAAFILLSLGGGLGWLFFPDTILPDVGQPGFTLANTFQRPHEAASLILMLTSLGLFWQGLTHQKKTPLFWGSLSFFLMLFFHPYNSIIIGTILLCFGLYWLTHTESVYFLRVLILLGIETGIYYLGVGRGLLANPAFSGLASQIQFSPAVIHSIFGWGILLPLILVVLLPRKKDKETVFFIIWFVSHWLITYLPVGFQRSLARGLCVPAVVLAVTGAKEICRRLNWDYRMFVAPLIIFASFSTFFMSYKRATESPENRWIYLTKEEGEVIEYLKNHGEDEEGVLASYRIANIIPAHTAKRVWAGHSFQTPNFERRINRVYQFFAGQLNEDEAKNLFETAKISWVFWGPEEKSIAKLTEIPTKNLLEPAVEGEVVSLYKVIQK